MCNKKLGVIKILIIKIERDDFMGLFDFIGNKIKEVADEAREAQEEAEYWSPLKTCNELKHSGIAKSSGYAKALKGKCRSMSDYELMDLFDTMYRERNGKACNAMFSVMEDRGLLYKDDEGKIHKNY